MADVNTPGTGKAFLAGLHEALRSYDRDDVLAGLALLADLQVTQAQLRACPALGLGRAVRAVLNAALDRLAQRDRQAADLLVRHFVRGESTAHLVRVHDCSERTIFTRQRQALAALAQVIWEAEDAARLSGPLSESQQAALAGLPPPSFSRLFGVGELLTRLKDFLRSERGCPLIALEGMGGIGKTALARTAAEELVREGCFGRVLWITARQQFFAWGNIQPVERPVLTYAELCEELYQALQLGSPLRESEAGQELRLRQALSREPTLIVVDNLETSRDIQAVVAGLDRLARPAKVLLTTRHRVAAYESVTSLTLRELSREDALAFIHYHAGERNVPAVLNAPLDALERIVAVTDGNPLALKLVIGQMHARPLAVVLDDLATTRAGAREFYRYIFRYSWDQLSPAARHLLLHMPLLDARGAAGEELAAVSGAVAAAEFWAAVEELVNCSLLNAGYAGGRLLYSIHRLTEYFILSDLVHAEKT
ncbi:MAG: NB-ARC domain-containing protein [Chloroflexi bacterium]|nr:NB-ARC domain-containing protein [Chloroflexota bacterium]